MGCMHILLKIGGGPRCVTYFNGVPNVTKCDRGRGQNWSKIARRTSWKAPGNETKREAMAIADSIWSYGISPVNKLVSLTWFLWALRSFRGFILQYTLHLKGTFYRFSD